MTASSNGEVRSGSFRAPRGADRNDRDRSSSGRSLCDVRNLLKSYERAIKGRSRWNRMNKTLIEAHVVELIQRQTLTA